MQIYFIIERKGYWAGTVTTSKELADHLKNENPEFEVLETELKPVDFVPVAATSINKLGSYSKPIDDYLFEKLQISHYFKPVYNRNDMGRGDKHLWVQTIHNGFLKDLETGIITNDFEDNFPGASLHLKMPDNGQ